MQLRFLIIYRTHQTRLGASSKFLETAYSATSTGLLYYSPAERSQLVVQSRVVFLTCLLHSVYGMAISLVINNALHKVELVALFITLCIHIFNYDVCSIFITVTIRELNLVGSCVQHGIVIGSHLHSPIKFTLLPYHLPSADLIPSRYPYLGPNILVISININIILILNIANVGHLGSREFIIFITLKSRSHEVSVVLIILEISVSHW
jgi:hypothetical protein